MPLAEAVSIDAGDVALILISLTLIFLAMVGAVVLGFVWAARAGRGSRRALFGWAVVATLEALSALPLLATFPDADGESAVLIAGPVLLAAQAIVFRRSRADALRKPEPPSST